jgi:hypothetical protein
MPEIEHPSHLKPSAHQKKQEQHPDLDPLIEDEDEGTDDDCTLADLKRKRRASTSKEGACSPSGELFSSIPEKPIVTMRKRPATSSAGGNVNYEQPR